MIKRLLYPTAQIFFTSFLILFLELSLIRYLPSQIAYLGYYSNFILLASFVGMGVGILLSKNQHRLLWMFPWALLFVVGFSSLFSVSIYPSSGGEMHFNSSFSKLIIPEFIYVPFIFLLVVIVFSMLSQKMGVMFDQLRPLVAYTWDILGSLCGIAVFTILSFLGLGPLVWFSVFAVIFLFSNQVKSRWWHLSCFAFVLLLGLLLIGQKDVRWSPYQKITVKPYVVRDGRSEKLLGHMLYVNNIAHQSLIRDVGNDQGGEMNVYLAPYRFVEDATFERALIIGSGAGNDVAVALQEGVGQIDAVEIDPEILEVGWELHPNRPYQDPRVRSYVDDARSFLQKTDKTYDLIVFALPDSLVLASGRGGIRLESFLFTEEAFLDARRHLAPDGLIVLYNVYRRPWLIAKLAGMLTSVFEQPTHVISGGPPGYLGVLLNGGRLDTLKSDLPASVTFECTPPPATDDWPFLYLEKRSVPLIYVGMLGIIFFYVYFMLSKIVSKPFYKVLEPSYFFLGVGFLLLETKSITQFSLLFGSTWLVNALVFFAILFLVFVAIHFSRRVKVQSVRSWYVVLVFLLLLQYLVPFSIFLRLVPFSRYVVVSLFTFAPLFIANVIFSLTFKESKNNSLNFASNIFGAAVGGILEYSAMLLGYRNLVYVILFCYVLAFYFPYLRKNRHRSW